MDVNNRSNLGLWPLVRTSFTPLNITFSLWPGSDTPLAGLLLSDNPEHTYIYPNDSSL